MVVTSPLLLPEEDDNIEEAAAADPRVNGPGLDGDRLDARCPLIGLARVMLMNGVDGTGECAGLGRKGAGAPFTETGVWAE